MDLSLSANCSFQGVSVGLKLTKMPEIQDSQLSSVRI